MNQENRAVMGGWFSSLSEKWVGSGSSVPFACGRTGEEGHSTRCMVIRELYKAFDISKLELLA